MRRILLLITLFAFSCKDQKGTKEVLDKQEKMQSYLTVIVKAKVLENDRFDLYFSDEIIGQYHPEDKVEVNVKGDKEFQEIEFNLPKHIYPMKLRLDVGSKEFETPIELDRIVLTTGVNSKVFEGSSLKEYFKPNKYLDSVGSTNAYNRKKVDSIYDPFFISININDIVTNLFTEADAK